MMKLSQGWHILRTFKTIQRLRFAGGRDCLPFSAGLLCVVGVPSGAGTGSDLSPDDRDDDVAWFMIIYLWLLSIYAGIKAILRPIHR